MQKAKDVECPLETSYKEYLDLGGIINENDYRSALERARNSEVLDREDEYEARGIENTVRQVKDIAMFSGIKLDSGDEVLDPKIVLYVILRRDIRPEGRKYYHDQMSDQRVFGEVLRMLGDLDSLEKLIKAHPQISFKYECNKPAG